MMCANDGGMVVALRVREAVRPACARHPGSRVRLDGHVHSAWAEAHRRPRYRCVTEPKSRGHVFSLPDPVRQPTEHHPDSGVACPRCEHVAERHEGVKTGQDVEPRPRLAHHDVADGREVKPGVAGGDAVDKDPDAESRPEGYRSVMMAGSETTARIRYVPRQASICARRGRSVAPVGRSTAWAKGVGGDAKRGRARLPWSASDRPGSEQSDLHARAIVFVATGGCHLCSNPGMRHG